MPGGCHILVSGRWDNTVAVVDLDRALDPANADNDNAVISRVRVTPDITSNGETVPASGQPVSLAVPRSGRYAYVVNHSGGATPQAAGAYQHGHPGLVTVLDIAAALDPANNGTTRAVAGFIPTGTPGPVGIAMTPDDRFILVTSAEAAEREDGGDEVTVIDAGSRTVVRRIKLGVRTDGAGRPQPSPHPAPHPSYGSFPDPNGVAVSARGFAFTANGGTDDVSVIDLERALAGEPAEIARVAVEAGPFGLAVSPDGALLAAASRESARTGAEGRTISLIDVDRATAGAADAERARVQVGTDEAAVATRPFAVAFTPDGKRVVATCFRSNTVSLVDVGAALAGRPAEAARLALRTPGGAPARPKGIVITPDGRHAAVTGGAKGGSGSSVLFLVDLGAFKQAGCVTGVGNESYFLDLFPRR
jgi:DNA-binding beta-propeller fold protein YncE